MKKFIYALVLLLAACNKPEVSAQTVIADGIFEHYQVIYSPSAKIWSDGGMVEDRIVFTKTVSVGSGNYSIYTSTQQTLQLSSNFEFLYNSRLFGYNTNSFKFSEVVYEDGKFAEKSLDIKEVQKLFAGLDVVAVSDAKDNVLNVMKWPFVAKQFLIVNDTERDFYHYSFEEKVAQDKYLNNLITVKNYGELIYSHFGSRNDAAYPILQLDVIWD